MNERSDRAERTEAPAPDIQLTAMVTADELEFREQPSTEVRFSGSPAHESRSGSERRNLPRPVRAQVRYREIEVNYRLATRVIPEAGDEGGESEDRRERPGAGEDLRS